MYHIRWIADNLDNFMIRLGYVKAIASMADVIGPGKDLALSRMQGVLCRDVDIEKIPWNDVLEDYLKKKPRTRSSRGNPNKIKTKQRTIELQDAYLSDPAMPSNLGAVARDAQYELLDWASWLGLIKQGSASLLSSGILLKSLAKDDIPSFSTYQPDRNPFMIRSERAYLLWLLLEKDGDFFRRLLPEILVGYGDRKFTRLDARNQYKAALSLMLEEAKSSENHVPLQERIEIRKALDKVKEDEATERRGERALHGIMRLSPRLENLVDLGYLENVSESTMPFSLIEPRRGFRLEYEYRSTQRTRELGELLGSSEKSDLDEILHSKYFGFLAKESSTPVGHDEDAMTILPYLVNAYRSFEREVGAKPILPICIGAACTALNEGRVYFEISEAMNALANLKKSPVGQHIRLSGGFTGNRPKFVLFERSLWEKS